MDRLYRLVDGFMGKCDIGQGVREHLSEGQQYADVDGLERIGAAVFDALVAYRMVLAPEVKAEQVSKHNERMDNIKS